MKTRTPIVTAAFLFLTLNSQLSTAFAQGSLTPPGAPAPTMKSLAQVEPRAPISSAPFTILVSGSYYLMTNVTVSSGDAITILANNVTLNLNGFTISSTQPTATTDSAILLGSVMNVAIFNGHISSGVTNSAGGVFGGSGFGNGIYNSGSRGNLRVRDVSVAGVLSSGIYQNSGLSTVVESCTVNVAGTYGIYADSVSDSTALNCGSCGIAADTAHNCKGYGIGVNADGLYATTANNCFGYSFGYGIGLKANTANNCYGESSSGFGLFASTANNCYGHSNGNSTYGLNANSANNCYGDSSGSGAGLNANTANNCYGFSSSGFGLDASSANNCYGKCLGSGDGLHASGVATGCYGSSYTGIGLWAFTASNCYGESDSGYGLYAFDLANTSYGKSDTATGLRAFIANSCDGSSLDVTHKYNMP